MDKPLCCVVVIFVYKVIQKIDIGETKRQKHENIAQLVFCYSLINSFVVYCCSSDGSNGSVASFEVHCNPLNDRFTVTAHKKCAVARDLVSN